MKILNRCVSALLLLFLFLTGTQPVLAEGYLYLFKKDFPPGDFTAVEAVTTEESEGNIKLTTAEGKLTVWGGNLVAAKYPLFDERKEAADPQGMQALIATMEKFIEQEPGSKNYLQTSINQRKELLARLQNKSVETILVTGDALSRFMGDTYDPERTYSIDYLEAKVKRGEQFKQLSPDQADKITEYLKPWAEELKYRNAGMERFDGKWQSVESVAKARDLRIAAEQKAFLEKLIYTIPLQVFSQNTIYIFLGVVGVFALILLVVAYNGLSNLSTGLGLGVIFSLLFGLGGLAAYGYGAWCLFKKPDGFSAISQTSAPAKAGGAGPEDIPLEELIFRVSQTGEEKAESPSRYLVDGAVLNNFLDGYLKISSPQRPGVYAVTRKGMKIRVLVDRVLIYDQMSWCKRELVACYTLFYTSNNDGFSFYKTEATLGTLPLPGKVFKFLWEQQVLPVVTDILNNSKVLDNYHVSRMENNLIELISNRNPPKIPQS